MKVDIHVRKELLHDHDREDLLVCVGNEFPSNFFLQENS